MSVGPWLRRLRHARGLTQVTVGERLGKAQNAISRMETQADCKVSTLAAYVGAVHPGAAVAVVFPDGSVRRLS